MKKDTKQGYTLLLENVNKDFLKPDPLVHLGVMFVFVKSVFGVPLQIIWILNNKNLSQSLERWCSD